MSLETKISELEQRMAAKNSRRGPWIVVNQCKDDPLLYEYEGERLTEDELDQAVGPHRRIAIVIPYRGPRRVNEAMMDQDDDDDD